MHMLQRSEHLVCHAPYQSQIMYLAHNEVLAWGGEVNSAFIVIFKNEFVFKRTVHMKSLSTFSRSFETSLGIETSNVFALFQCVSISIAFLAGVGLNFLMPFIFRFVTVLLMNIEAEDRK